MSEKQTSVELAKAIFDKASRGIPASIQIECIAEIINQVRDEVIEECTHIAFEHNFNCNCGTEIANKIYKLKSKGEAK